MNYLFGQSSRNCTLVQDARLGEIRLLEVLTILQALTLRRRREHQAHSRGIADMFVLEQNECLHRRTPPRRALRYQRNTHHDKSQQNPGRIEPANVKATLRYRLIEEVPQRCA